MNGSSSPIVIHLREPLVRSADVDVGDAVVAEDEHIAVEVQVDAGGLNAAVAEGLDDDPALGQLLPYRAVAQDHGLLLRPGRCEDIDRLCGPF